MKVKVETAVISFSLTLGNIFSLLLGLRFIPGISPTLVPNKNASESQCHEIISHCCLYLIFSMYTLVLECVMPLTHVPRAYFLSIPEKWYGMVSDDACFPNT